jgi:hypothetical protein
MNGMTIPKPIISMKVTRNKTSSAPLLASVVTDDTEADSFMDLANQVTF